MRLALIHRFSVVALFFILGCGSPKTAAVTQLAKDLGSLRSTAANATTLSIASEKQADLLLRELDHLPDLQFLTIINVNLDQLQLESIGACHDLIRLRLVKCDIDDDDLRHIAGLTSLRDLKIAYAPAQLTGSGFSHLESMTKLRKLDVNSSDVDGTHLSRLKTLKSLRELDISHTKIGDESVDSLLELTQLTSIHTAETRLTRKGCLTLAQLPNLSEPPVPNDFLSGDIGKIRIEKGRYRDQFFRLQEQGRNK